MAVPIDTSAIQDHLSELAVLIKQVDSKRQKSEPTLKSISKLHTKLRQDQRMSSVSRDKLRSLYKTAKADAVAEEALLREALATIYKIRNIRNERLLQPKQGGKNVAGGTTLRRGALMKLLYTSAQTLPLWVGRPHEKPPPLCGCVPADSNYIAKAGELVAALVRSPAATGLPVDDTWILATVVSWSSGSSRYEVEDIDEEQQERHLLSRRKVQPLPLYRADPQSHPSALFHEQSIVMALYPQTTCFYKAVINKMPTQATEEYQILFEDQAYPGGYSPPLPVPQRYVIPQREKKA